MPDPTTETPDARQDYLAGLRERQDALTAKQDELIGKQTEQADKTIGAIDQLRAKREAIVARPVGAPAQPHLQSLPEAPQPQQKNPIEAFRSPLVFLALAGSLLSRRPAVAAMNAASGIMEGYHKADEERIAHERENFKTALDQVMKQNSLELEKYNAAMSATGLSMREREAQLSALAASHNDVMLQNQIRQGNFQTISQVLRDRQTSLDRMVQAREQADRFERTQAERERHNAAIEGGGSETGLSSEALRDAAIRYIRTGTFPPNLGRGIQGKGDRNAILNKVSEVATELNIDESNLPIEWQRYRSAQTAITRFGSGKQGDTIRSFNVLVDHLNTFEQLAAALKNNDVRRVNQLANLLQTEFGGKDQTNFEVAKEIIGDEVIKSVLGGPGGVTDRQGIKARIDSSQSWDVLEGVVKDVIRPLAMGQLNGLRQQFTSSTRLPEKDFDEMLFPGTREFFKGAEKTNKSEGGWIDMGNGVRIREKP